MMVNGLMIVCCYDFQIAVAANLPIVTHTRSSVYYLFRLKISHCASQLAAFIILWVRQCLAVDGRWWKIVSYRITS